MERGYPQVTKEEWAYIAGVFDGEGCISVNKNSKTSFIIVLEITNTNKTIIDYAFNRFGGYIRKEIRGGNSKDIYRWRLARCLEVLDFLIGIYPYSKIKIGHIKIAIGYLQAKRNVICMADNLKRRITDLNRRGKFDASQNTPVEKQGDTAGEKL